MNLAPHAPLPEPAQTAAVRALIAGVPTTLIVHRWHPGDADRCGRCAVCNATRGADGASMCVVEAHGHIADAEAHAHRPAAPLRLAQVG